MYKEMIHSFFLPQTHGASTWTTKISSFKHVFRRNVAYGGRQAKKHTFVGTLDFQMDLATKSRPSKASNCMEQKLLMLKDPLKFSSHTISSLSWGKTSLPARTANKLQILSSSQSLRLLTNVTIAYFKRAILKRSEKTVFKGRSPHQTSCQNDTLEPFFTSKCTQDLKRSKIDFQQSTRCE